MDQIQHWGHEHPLILKTDKIENEDFRCRLCYKDIVAPYNYYACDSCEIYIHKSCSELPDQIDHSFHPSHPLYLQAAYSYDCDFCRKHFEEALAFACHECNFYLDVECALMSPITCKGKEHMQHFLIEVDSKDITSVCFVCHTTLLSSGGVYGCINCKLLLHKSCAELPRKILHPHHPNHDRLTLRTVAHEWFTCRLCSKDRQTLSFGCDECGFQLCVKCGMAMKGTIQCEDHEHLLCFLEETYTKLLHCDGCDAYCRQPVASNSTEFSNPPPVIYISMSGL